MGQKLTANAEAEAERLLEMALVILDKSDCYLAAAFVAQALEQLDLKRSTQLSESHDTGIVSPEETDLNRPMDQK